MFLGDQDADNGASAAAQLSGEPFGKASFDLILRNDSTCIRVVEPQLDSLANTNVILNVLKGGVIGETFEDLPYLFFWRVHARHYFRCGARLYSMRPVGPLAFSPGRIAPG